MPKMSFKDANFHASQDLIYAIHNPEPSVPLLKLGYWHKEVLRTLADIFRKAIPPAVPPRVPVREGFQ